jgi:hypothetical protein
VGRKGLIANSRPQIRHCPKVAQGAGRNGRPLLLAHAAWIAAEIPQTRRRRVEDLERKARFLAQSAKNAP